MALALSLHLEARTLQPVDVLAHVGVERLQTQVLLDAALFGLRPIIHALR